MVKIATAASDVKSVNLDPLASRDFAGNEVGKARAPPASSADTERRDKVKEASFEFVIN